MAWLMLACAGQVLWTAHVGDSRAVLARGATAVRLTEDHKPNLAREKCVPQLLGGPLRAFPPMRLMHVPVHKLTNYTDQSCEVRSRLVVPWHGLWPPLHGACTLLVAIALQTPNIQGSWLTGPAA